MATQNIDDKIHVVQPAKKSSNSNEDPDAFVPLANIPQSTSVPLKTRQGNTIATSTDIGPKSRIVVVRPISQTKNEETGTVETKEPDKPESVQIPAVLTNGHTSIYLIRRPIPPPETPRQTKLYKSAQDAKKKIISSKTTKSSRVVVPGDINNATDALGITTDTNNIDGPDTMTTSNGDNVEALGTTNGTSDIEDLDTTVPVKNTITSPSQVHSSFIRPKTSKRPPSLHQPGTPQIAGVMEIKDGILVVHSPPPSTPKNSKRRRSRRLHRSRSRERTQDVTRSDSNDPSDSKSRRISRHRSRSRRRISPRSRSVTPSRKTQGQSSNDERIGSDDSTSKTRNTTMTTNLITREKSAVGKKKVPGVRPTLSINALREKSALTRTKSSKSIVLVNPEDQTVAVVENPYLRSETTASIKTNASVRTTTSTVSPFKSIKSQLRDNSGRQSKEKLVETVQQNTCLGCLASHICLIIIICCILIVIGLAGIGVSAYFLASNSTTNLVPTIVGIVVGAVIALAAIIFLCCVLACIGSREGYFSYEDESRQGGRAFALIPPSHPNAHRYIPRDYVEPQKTNNIPISNTVSGIPTTQEPMTHRSNFPRSYGDPNRNVYPPSVNPVSSIPPSYPPPTNRQKTIVTETNDSTNSKNIIIQMPERLLTARKGSPKTHERKINHVVTSIGRIVEDAKKRYNGDVPNKVIVKVDENVKPVT